MTTFDGVIETQLEYILGTDKPYDFIVWTSDEKTACRDATGYTTSFKVKRKLTDADVDALLTVAGSVIGVFNADPAINTQRVRVAIVDTDTDTELRPGLAYWELKRTDAGFEWRLAAGHIDLRRGVHIA